MNMSDALTELIELAQTGRQADAIELSLRIEKHLTPDNPYGYVLSNGAFTQNINEVVAHNLINVDKALPLFTHVVGSPVYLIIDHNTLWRQVGKVRFDQTPEHCRMKLIYAPDNKTPLQTESPAR